MVSSSSASAIETKLLPLLPFAYCDQILSGLKCLHLPYYLKNLFKNSAEINLTLSIGGSNPGVAQTANVDILNTETGEWTPVEQLPVARSAPGCILTEIDGEEGVMLTGGFNTAQGEHLYDSLFYRPSTGKWEQVSSCRVKK